MNIFNGSEVNEKRCRFSRLDIIFGVWQKRYMKSSYDLN